MSATMVLVTLTGAFLGTALIGTALAALHDLIAHLLRR